MIRQLITYKLPQPVQTNPTTSVVASLYNRNSLHDIVERTAKEIFIPLTVGGGLRTIDDIKGVLRAGADKVSLNTAAINNLCDQFRSPHLWTKENGEWKLRHAVWHEN